MQKSCHKLFKTIRLFIIKYQISENMSKHLINIHSNELVGGGGETS